MDIWTEQNNLKPDTKAFMYGRVVDKRARYNLCFDDVAQAPDFNNKKGTIVSYDDIPLTKCVRDNLNVYFGNKAKNLAAEGNYYYDISKCGISFHGDGERKKVIAIRLGQTLPLHYNWFYQGKAIGTRRKIDLNGGDLYAMSEKAVGSDWKKKTILTLRHAAGCESYLTIKSDKNNKKQKKISFSKK